MTFSRWQFVGALFAAIAMALIVTAVQHPRHPGLGIAGVVFILASCAVWLFTSPSDDDLLDEYEQLDDFGAHHENDCFDDEPYHYEPGAETRDEPELTRSTADRFPTSRAALVAMLREGAKAIRSLDARGKIGLVEQVWELTYGVLGVPGLFEQYATKAQLDHFACAAELPDEITSSEQLAQELERNADFIENPTLWCETHLEIEGQREVLKREIEKMNAQPHRFDPFAGVL